MARDRWGNGKRIGESGALVDVVLPCKICGNGSGSVRPIRLDVQLEELGIEIDQRFVVIPGEYRSSAPPEVIALHRVWHHIASKKLN